MPDVGVAGTSRVRTDASSHVVDTALRAYVGLDVAVNNAGMLGPFMPTADVPVDAYDRIMAVKRPACFAA